jgi:hypothetical protein
MHKENEIIHSTIYYKYIRSKILKLIGSIIHLEIYVLKRRQFQGGGQDYRAKKEPKKAGE